LGRQSVTLNIGCSHNRLNVTSVKLYPPCPHVSKWARPPVVEGGGSTRGSQEIHTALLKPGP